MGITANSSIILGVILIYSHKELKTFFDHVWYISGIPLIIYGVYKLSYNIENKNEKDLIDIYYDRYITLFYSDEKDVLGG
jgi:hypothetical protein